MMTKIVQLTAEEVNKLYVIEEVSEGLIKQKMGAKKLGIG